MDPFKLKIGSNPLKAAKKIFGEPQEIHFSNHPSRTEMGWRMHDHFVETELTVSYAAGSDTVQISISYRAMDSNMMVLEFNILDSTRDKLERFVESVKKPWSEWGECEIMESPVWMALHREETGESTPAIETKMVMLSFETPDDTWVKRYFGKLQRALP